MRDSFITRHDRSRDNKRICPVGEVCFQKPDLNGSIMPLGMDIQVIQPLYKLLNSR